MRALRASACVLVIAAGCGSGAASRNTAPAPAVQDPDRFVSAAGGYSVIFPGAPELSSKSVETGIGTITLHSASVLVETAPLGAFTVTYADLPSAGDLHMVNVNRELLRKPPRTLISEKEIEITSGLVKGYEIVFEEDVMEKTTRFFEIGGRYYQLMVEYKKGERPSGMRKFFDSFRMN